MSKTRPTVAISADFLTAFSRVPKNQQKKVREFAERFRRDPASSSINYEPVHSARDSKVRSVRIGLDYRAIVIHPEKGSVYLLVWVDHHDQAMAWAANKVFDVNAYTGALQVVDLLPTEVPPAAAAVPPAAQSDDLLAAFSDGELLSLGTPQALLPSVRAVRTESDLDAIVPHLPEEAGEALYMLAMGYSLDEVRAEMQKRPLPAPAAEPDYVAALDHPDSRRRFAVVHHESDLSEMLAAPLEKWRVFLHPSQEALVSRDFNGPARVLGGAGTGKTVVAMHRARHLAKAVFPADTDRVLLVTFTRNLARSIEGNLRALCGDGKELERIEVTHLHRWLMRFLRAQGVKTRIAEGEQLTECWQEALATSEDLEFCEAWLRAEWDQVVQAQGLRSREEYLQAPRVGRVSRVSRAQKARVWEVFSEFRSVLGRRGLQEWADAEREAAAYLRANQGSLPYRAVVVDETQDLSPGQLRLIRAMAPEAPNDIFLVGDAHQRIYGRRQTLKHCGINVVGRSSRLRLNYRTTDEIGRWSTALLHGTPMDDLDGGTDDSRGYMSLLHGVKPEVHLFGGLKEELAFVVSHIKRLLEVGRAEHVCLTARMTRLLEGDYARALQEAHIPFVELDQQEESDSGEGVRLATMHRVKGLEYPHVLIVGVTADYVPPRSVMDRTDDPAERAELEVQERCLLYVAATRARDTLTITSYGEPSPLLGLR